MATHNLNGVRGSDDAKCDPMGEHGALVMGKADQGTNAMGQQAPEENTVECGFGPIRPSQKCANMKVFTLNMSVVLLLCVSYTTYQAGSVRTLERRFDLSSTQSGVLLSIVDALQSLAAGVIGYLGGRIHKPRLIVVTTMLTAVGIMLYATPYFVYGPKLTPPGNTNSSTLPLDTPDLTCHPGGGRSAAGQTCSMAETAGISGLGLSGPFIILILASIVSSQGSSPIYCLGIPYIEENVDRDSASVYVGVVFSMYAWSKLAGLLLAAVTTRLPESLTDSRLSPEDPDFIGAWWLGYVILAILIVLTSATLTLFPKHFSNYYSLKKANKEQEAMKVTPEQGFTRESKDFLKAVVRLLTNPVYLTMNLSDLCTTYLVTGVLSQLPRYLEVHYHQPTYLANILSACSAAISGIVGILLGGFLLKRFRLSTLGAARVYLVALVVGLVGVLLAMLMSCPGPQWYGTDKGLSLSQTIDGGLQCNDHCDCAKKVFRPVCDVTRVTYLSPCHAGCDGGNMTQEVYTNCTCAAAAPSGQGYPLSAGFCSSSCTSLVPYVLVIFVSSFIGAIGSVPSIMIVLRIVEPRDKSMAIGIRSTMFNLLGFVPGPVLFGALVDVSCLLWRDTCTGRGSCLVYDTTRYRLLTHGVAAAFQTIAVLLGIASYILIRRRQAKYPES